MHADDQHLFVIGAVENPDPTARRRVLGIAPHQNIRAGGDRNAGLRPVHFAGNVRLHDTVDAEFEESGTTFAENSRLKAIGYSRIVQFPVLADDSGLEVSHLGGKPGVHSSRYSGNDTTDEENMKKLLGELTGVPAPQRDASFRCVLVLYHPDGRFESFEGELRGRIHDRPMGNGGFGYDPVFFIPDFGMTVAQISPEVKNRISHRAQAFEKLKKNLQQTIFPE